MPGFSPQAITALVEAATGGSFSAASPNPAKYRSGPEIVALLGNCGIDLSVGSQSRVPAVRDVLTAINRSPAAHDRLRPLFQAVVNPADYRGSDQAKHGPLVAYLNDALRADGYVLAESGGRYRLLAVGAQSLAAEAVLDASESLTLDSVRRDTERALAAVSTDPEDSLTSACAMVESVCKSILADLRAELPDNPDISGLYGAVARALELAPGRSDLGQDLRSILSGMITVVKNIGALRTHGGDAHGREAGLPPPDARMARLAIHAAAAISEFLIETWQRQHGRQEPAGGAP